MLNIKIKNIDEETIHILYIIKMLYKKVKNDTYGAIPLAGAINIITYAIPILVLD